ncbi:MAG: hypothetical protein LUQ67_02690 [Methanomicrobiales archaeon]|nr:hypothetical protein [Methanomicrobiales archaeon]
MNRELLCRSWIHSHEEDEGTLMVFRPASHRFPPSRGRKGYTFHEDGTYDEIGPGPADRPVPGRGKWSLEDDGMLTILPSGGASVRVLRIVSLEPDRMVVEKG